MKPICILFWCLICLTAESQSAFVVSNPPSILRTNGTTVFNVPIPSGGGGFNPSQILTNLWWYSDTSPGAVSNWVDRLNGAIMTNSSATAPTNLQSSVYFNGAQKMQLSNTLTMPSGYTFWCCMTNFGTQPGTGTALESDSPGNTVIYAIGGFPFGNADFDDFFSFTDHRFVSPSRIMDNTMTTLAICNGTFYTNGVAVASSTYTPSASSRTIFQVGNDGTGNFLLGGIRGIGFALTNLSQSAITQLDTWARSH